jgi:hypothetical protein
VTQSGFPYTGQFKNKTVKIAVIDLPQFKPISLFISILPTSISEKIFQDVNHWFHWALRVDLMLINCAYMVVINIYFATC